MTKKILFMGTPDFAVPILEALNDSTEYEIVGVVSQPDRPVGRKRVLTPPPIAAKASELNLTLFQPENINEEKEALKAIGADLIVTAAYGQLIHEDLLEAPEFGSINVHASLLPKYRGGAPIHRAVRNNEPETGVTIMYMVKKLDAGDMLAKAAIPITSEDDTGTMFDKLSLLGRDLLLQTLPELFAGEITATPQDESEATYSPNIARHEEQIDWSEEAARVDALIRALRPEPGAYTYLDGERLKIFQVEVLTEKTSKEPGTIIALYKKAMDVACGGGTVLRLKEVQPSGKKAMPIANFLNGAGKDLEVGDRFDSTITE